MLTGDLWRVVEGNDCDLRLEVSAAGAGRSAPCVVAEVPVGPACEAARADVPAAVRLPSAHARDRVDLATPVRVALVGYGFWDDAHSCRRDGVRGCSHGTATVATLWELHPVWRVEVVGAVAAVRPDGLRVPPFPADPPEGLQVPLYAARPDGLRVPRSPPTTSDGLLVSPYPDPSTGVSERLRCCDGSRSPTCRVGRANGHGCRRGHGGVCGGIEPKVTPGRPAGVLPAQARYRRAVSPTPRAVLVAALLVGAGACRNDERGCLVGEELACACPAGVGGVQTCGRDGWFGTCVCRDPARVAGAYEGCAGRERCAAGTACTPVTFNAGGLTALCTVPCVAGADCPTLGADPSLPPTCVIDLVTDRGRCFGTCRTDADCGPDTRCEHDWFTGRDVCIPGHRPVRPPRPPAYAACFAGEGCEGGTSCLPVDRLSLPADRLSLRPAPDSLCTVSCDDEARCPGYVPGAAVQTVACVAHVGGRGDAVCMRVCDPARGNADCGDAYTFCRAATLLEGVRYVCAP